MPKTLDYDNLTAAEAKELTAAAVAATKDPYERAMTKYLSSEVFRLNELLEKTSARISELEAERKQRGGMPIRLQARLAWRFPALRRFAWFAPRPHEVRQHIAAQVATPYSVLLRMKAAR